MYWQSPDCYQRFLRELPASKVSKFIHQKRHQVQMSQIVEIETTTPQNTSRFDIPKKEIDPHHHETYLTETDPMEVFKVLIL